MPFAQAWVHEEWIRWYCLHVNSGLHNSYNILSSLHMQIQSGKGDVTITNDGATILKQMKLVHPAAKMVII